MIKRSSLQIFGIENIFSEIIPEMFPFLQILTRAIRQENEINAYRKKKVKLSLFADDTIAYLKGSRGSTRRLRFEKFSNIARYKANIQN
jgi:hypothetical protein